MEVVRLAAASHRTKVSIAASIGNSGSIPGPCHMIFIMRSFFIAFLIIAAAHSQPVNPALIEALAGVVDHTPGRIGDGIWRFPLSESVHSGCKAGAICDPRIGR